MILTIQDGKIDYPESARDIIAAVREQEIENVWTAALVEIRRFVGESPDANHAKRKSRLYAKALESAVEDIDMRILRPLSRGKMNGIFAMVFDGETI